MKKLVIVLALIASASSAFAGQFISGSVYSIGSIAPTPYKPSPKVTVNYYLATDGTDWAAISYHQSAINNKKGQAYWTSKSDPGMYYYKNDTSGVATSVVAAPTTSAAPTATGWNPLGQ